MIPRTIHQIWLGSQIPDRYQRFAEMWRSLHPEWEYILWSEDTVTNLENKKVFDATTSWAQKADIARYEIVLKHGGVYIDTDFEPVRPLDELSESADFFTCAQSGRTFAIGLFGACPGHPILQDVVRRLPSSYVAHHSITKQTGPDLFTASVDRYVSRYPDDHSIKLFRHEYFYPLRPWDPPIDQPAGEVFPRSYAVHHWDKSWGSDEECLPRLRERVAATSLTDTVRAIPIALPAVARDTKDHLRRTAAIRAKRVLRRVLPRSPIPPVPMGDGRLLVSTIHGFPILVNNDDIGITSFLAIGGSYEGNILEYIARTTPNGSTVVDVGANIGLHTVALARAVGPNGRVLSYECNPIVEALLRDNVRLNMVSDRVRLFALAASDHTGTLELHYSPKQMMLGSTRQKALETPNDEVVTISVPCGPIEVDKGVDIDLVKIDVEGAEPAVLRGLMPLIDAGRVRRILVELKVQLLGDAMSEVELILRHFAQLGMKFALVGDDGNEEPLTLADVLVIGEFGNLLIERGGDS